MTTSLIRVALTIGLTLLHGCGGVPFLSLPGGNVDTVASDEHFALVRLQQDQDLGDIAEAFYGDSREAWQIEEINSRTMFNAGQVVAVPLEPTNSSSVYPDGYRTLPILCYHQFTQDKKTSNRLELNVDKFEQQMVYLLNNDFQFLSFADISDIVRNGRPVPHKAVVVTIDDGYRSVYDVAWPILKKYKIKTTLFLYTDFVGAGKALNWSQIKEMENSGLVEIESHGKSHSSLSRLASDESEELYRARLQSEFSGSQKRFKRHVNSSPQYLSYPYGNSSATAASLLESAGYKLAATVTRGDNASFSDPYLLHRTMIYDNHDIDQFARLLRTFRSKSLK